MNAPEDSVENAPEEDSPENVPDQTPDRTPGKSQPNILRIVLFGLLGIMLIVAYFELSSRRKAQAAYDRIDSSLADNKTIEQETLHEWMGREPDSTSDIVELTRTFEEAFEFKGPLKKRTVTVEYSKRAATLVQKVSIE